MEEKRILRSKAFLAVLLALVVLNIFFFYQRTGTEEIPLIDPELYHQRMEELSPYDWQTAQDINREYIDDLTAQQPWDPQLQAELDAAQQVQSQYEYLSGYQGYLDQIKRSAELLKSVSLFADTTSEAYHNILKTDEDFAAMDGVPVQAGHDLAVTEFFSDKWADYSILIVICLVCGLFLAERKDGLWPMIYAAPGGRSRLALRRVGILFSAAWIGTVVIVGSKILLCGWEYHGLSEWGRTIQSIPMFLNVPTPMTVGEFWLLYIAAKALGAFWFGLVLWAILSSISNLGLALCAVSFAVAVEYAFTAIPSNSLFAMLRYVNIFSYVDFSTVFTRYLNLNAFGTLISGSDLVLAMLLPLCLIFAVLDIVIAHRKHSVAPANRLLGVFDAVQKKLDPIFAGGGEIRKLLIKRKGILLLILLILVVRGMEVAPRTYVAWDPYIQFYEARFAGPINDEKIEAMEAELEALNDPYSQEGLKLVIEAAKTAPEGAWIVPSEPYDAIWSNNEGNYHRTTALMALLFLALLLSPIASQERQNDMPLLLHSTTGGQKRLVRHKQILIVSLAALIFALVYGTEIWLIVKEYGQFQYLNAPAMSVQPFRELGWGVPLWLALALFYLVRLLVMAAVAEVCYLLSARCSKNRDATLLCIGVILIPAALATIGSIVGEYLSFLIPLSTAELLW